jgi:two-component system sensor histidine kinase QseC
VFVLRSGSSWVQVAEKEEVRDELLHDLGVAVMTPLVSGAVILLVLVNLLVLYGLAPLRQLAASIEKRDPDALGLLEIESVPEEVAPVVRALNDLLVRVQDALERERRFTDAAAHELRTPLAALRIHADNMVRATTDAERMQSMGRLRQGLERASKLAEQMLAYSRTQDSTDREQPAPIDLPALVREAVVQLEPLRQARAQTIELDMPAADDGCAILGEPTLLRRLVVNLLDNASRYAPSGSTIRVELRRQADRVALAVANSGPAIPADLKGRVFEPYYRIPGSSSDGSGLGLAIVKQIADRHGATIELGTLDDGSGTTLRINFPADPESTPQLSRRP